MSLAEGASCATHPRALARAACTRCGSYACDACLAGGLRSEPLCAACDRSIASAHVRRVTTAARVVRGALLVHAVLAVAGTLGVLMYGMPGEDDVGQSMIDAGAGIGVLVALLSWCVWFRRANGSLGARNMQLRFGPNAWAWIFVPFAFWVRPYQAVVELYTRALDEHVEPPWVPLWWGLWLLGNLVTPNTWDTTGFTPLQITRNVAGSLLLAGAALLAQHLVKLVTQGLSAPGPVGGAHEPAPLGDFR